ncbi:DUF3024 domain-containing protein [Janibacter hoylei]|uniref:DUF3024 domain-containing protein n=1 Tax=Janibacter hoylei TaxID=364298 RepID=UPI0036BAF296
MRPARSIRPRAWPTRSGSSTTCGATTSPSARRAPWAGEGEWTHQPLAQLRYLPDERRWTLHWADRNSRWHEYHEGNVFIGSAAELLTEIDEDPTCIFWG